MLKQSYWLGCSNSSLHIIPKNTYHKTNWITTPAWEKCFSRVSEHVSSPTLLFGAQTHTSSCLICRPRIRDLYPTQSRIRGKEWLFPLRGGLGVGLWAWIWRPVLFYVHLRLPALLHAFEERLSDAREQLGLAVVLASQGKRLLAQITRGTLIRHEHSAAKWAYFPYGQTSLQRHM